MVHFEEVARDSPLDAKAHHNLAAAYHKAKRLDDAQQVAILPCAYVMCYCAE